MIIMMGGWSIGQSFFEIDLLSLGHPGPGGLPPSMIEFKEQIIQMVILVSGSFQLVKIRRDVA